MTSPQGQLYDSAQGYGTVSRFLHWSMTFILTWQFASALAHALLEDTAIEQFLWSSHKAVGALLLVLIVVRAAWALYNRKHRPPSLSIMAKLGHLALYGLMLVIPLLALARQYGSGREFSPFGIPLMSGFDDPKKEWLMAPANLLHGPLGWLLLAMVCGHIIMVFVHRHRAGDEDVLKRMLGNRRAR